jgi:CRISPR system Cascade subunit CasD
MMMVNTLFLRLESPLQSWGENSQWSERRTAPEPTKSGIVGLLACALGWNDDKRIRALSQHIRIGARCDLPGTPSPLVDYHTVGGGYITPQLITAEGKLKLSSGKPHTEQTWRYYLCDASFLIAIQPRQLGNTGLINALAAAVQNPVWPIYLGRKSCPPSRPVYDDVDDYATLDEALEKHPARFTEDILVALAERRPRIVVECEPLLGTRRRNQLVSRDYWLHEPTYTREFNSSKDIQVEHLTIGV